MIAAVVAVLILAFFTVVTWIADRTQPRDDAEVVPFRQKSHVALTDRPLTREPGEAS